MDNTKTKSTTTVTVSVYGSRVNGENVYHTNRGHGKKVGKVRADYSGGAYVELTFDDSGAGYVRAEPSEVINVWNYETSRADIGMDAADVRAVVVEWCQSYVAEPDSGDYWPGWFRGYMENR